MASFESQAAGTTAFFARTCDRPGIAMRTPFGSGSPHPTNTQ